MTPSTVIAILLTVTALFLQSNGVRTKPCNLDNVCFVLDRSFSMRDSYRNVQELTVRVGAELSTRTSTVVYSAFGFSDSAVTIIDPTTSLADFTNAVEAPVSPSGGTNMYSGVDECYKTLEDAEGNNVIVLVTDGEESGRPPASDLKSAIEFANFGMITVGIGSEADVPYLEYLATEPRFYIPSSKGSLPEKAHSLAVAACDVADIYINACQKAYESCKLRFRGAMLVPTYNMNAQQDRVFSEKILSRTAERVGMLNTSDITPEFLGCDGIARPITSFGSQRFTPTHFKPLSKPSATSFSGIAHQTFQGDQESVARSKCVRVFFTNFQVLSKGKNPNVITNMNVLKTDNYCVVFKTV